MLRSKGVLPADFEMLQREMERFLDYLAECKRSKVTFAKGLWHPPVDVYESADEVTVLAEIAGADAADIQVTVEGTNLTIAGVRKAGGHGANAVHQLEIHYGPFLRSIKLPGMVKGDEARASYLQGFLEIVLPKAPAVRQEPVIIQATG